MNLHRELERQLELSGYDAEGFAERYRRLPAAHAG